MNLVNINLASRNWIERVQLWLIIGILLFIPISPAIPNTFALLLIVVWLIEGDFREKWLFLSRHPLFWGMTTYLLIYPLSLLWSENMEWGWHMVERHMIFLLFPFLLTSLKSKYMKVYILAFIAGVTAAEITSYAVWFGVLEIEGVSAANPVPFYVHTQYNPVLAWALYLLMSALFLEKHPVWIKALSAFFVVTMSINMFITGGRGGQLTYFILAALVVWQFLDAHHMRYRGVLIALAFAGLVGTGVYQWSPLFQQRADLAAQGIMNFDKEQCEGSVGIRLCWYANTLKLSLQNSVWGSGVGDFPEDYTKFVGPDSKAKLVAARDVGHSHPHNQFLYELGALGVLGLAILLWIFVSLLRVALKWFDYYRGHRMAFVVYMTSILMTDSLLLAYSTSLVFITFSAILFFRPIVENPLESK